MKNDKTKFLLCFLFFVLLAVITFRCTWLADHVFSASDMNIGRLAFKKNYLPESLTGFYTANQVMGVSGSALTLFTVLLACMPLVLFANVFYGMMLVAGSLSMVWFLRMWNRGWLASVFGALIAFWLNSILLAHVGHAYKVEVLVFSVLGLCLVEKSIRATSIRQSIGFSTFAGVSVGIMMIEQQDVALLAGLFLCSYALFRLVQVHGRTVFRWLIVLVPLAVVALLLSGNTLLNSYKQNIAGASSVQGGGGDKWNYVTQWSAVPEEWPDLIALGWGGWSTGNPKGPYWGKLGRSAEWEKTGQGFQNFKLNSVYFGILPFLMGGYGLAIALRNRKTEEGKSIVFWSVAGLLGFWLAFGKYSLLYKLFYQFPLLGDIRAPIKLLDNFQICLGIVAAYGLDRLISDGKESKSTKVLWIACTICAGLMLMAGVKVLAFPASWVKRFTEMGYGSYSEVLVRCMSNAWLHAGLFALLCGVLAFLAWKGFKQTKWIAVAFIALIATDSLVLTSRHFQADDISQLRRGNGLINYLMANQGNERTFFVDTGGIYNQWLAMDGPFNGLHLFNIWQMPRMPVEYKEYLGTVGQNQIRLWQLSAVKYIAAPAGVMQQFKQNPQLGNLFKPVLNYQVPTAQGMRPDVLLEFKGAIPRFALFHNWDLVPVANQCEQLISPEHNPTTTVLVDSASGIESHAGGAAFQPLVAETTKKKATINVKTDAPAIVRFSQRYQPSWTVLVDGKPASLLRLDYLSMGVQVPPGNHVIVFRCVNNTLMFIFRIGVFTVAVVVAVLLLMRRRNFANQATKKRSD